MGDENSVFGLKYFFSFNTNAIDYEMPPLAPLLFPLFYPTAVLSSSLFHHIHLPRFKKLQSLYEYNIQRHSFLPTQGKEGVNG